MSPYDGRFITGFRRELVKRGCPFYPEPRWHSALQAADLEQPCSSPPAELGATLTPVKVTSHQRRLATEKYLMVSVSRDCDKWWRKYGPA